MILRLRLRSRRWILVLFQQHCALWTEIECPHAATRVVMIIVFDVGLVATSYFSVVRQQGSLTTFLKYHPHSTTLTVFVCTVLVLNVLVATRMQPEKMGIWLSVRLYEKHPCNCDPNTLSSGWVNQSSHEWCIIGLQEHPIHSLFLIQVVQRALEGIHLSKGLLQTNLINT